MFIEQPPISYRLLYAGTIWRIPQKEKKTVYLTFDDGPIPEVTSWGLDLLDKYDIKATFVVLATISRHAQILSDQCKERFKGHRTFTPAIEQMWRYYIFFSGQQ